MNCMLIAIVVATVLGCSVAVNPLGRFGARHELCEYDRTYDFEANGGIWTLQYRPAHCDNYAHQCQATYETKEKWFKMTLYYYAMNEMINETIVFQFKSCKSGSLGCYTGAITLDCKAVNIFLYVLYVTKDFRITYMYTDAENADLNIYQVLGWTREFNPCDAILADVYNKMIEMYKINFGISCPELDRVVQDPKTCEPVIEMEICGCP